VKSVTLAPDWRRNILSKASDLSEHQQVMKEKERLNERLRRLGRAFVDGLIEEPDIPEVEASFDAGEKLENLGSVWKKASLEEKHSLLLVMLDAVYLDLAQTRSVVSIRPKGPFYPLFRSLRQESDAGIRIVDPEQEGGWDGGGANCGMVETGEGARLRNSRANCWPLSSPSMGEDSGEGDPDCDLKPSPYG
jgi:hypothetical protein